MSQSSHPGSHADQQSQRIDELEVRLAFMEDTVEVLNQQLAAMTQEFSAAKQAMHLLYQRLEQVQSSQSLMKDLSDETPPPHY